MSYSDKNCECGHFGKEHLWGEKSLHLLFRGAFLGVPQENRGLCKKCSCPKFQTSRVFRLKRKIEYTQREKYHDESEERCAKCGRLLVNHKEANHSFWK